jgi:hypothetical protein
MNVAFLALRENMLIGVKNFMEDTHNYGDGIKEKEMGGACGTYGVQVW